jgi:hypothetical protein
MVRYSQFGLVISVIIAYYSIISLWIPEVIKKLIIGITSVGFVGPVDLVTNFGQYLSGAGTINSVLVPYLYSFQIPATFSVIIWIARISALSLTSLGLLIISFEFIKTREFKRPQVIAMAFIIQGISFAFIIPLFAPSGGISPIKLLLFFTPIFGGYFASKSFQYTSNTNIEIRHIVVCILTVTMVLSLFTSGMIISTWKPNLDNSEISTTSESEILYLNWAGKYADGGTIFSDFQTLSSYYTIGGTGKSKIYIPTPPVYNSKSDSESVVRLFYKNPQSVDADSYLVSNSMEQKGMYHLGTVFTKPNRRLGSELSKNHTWVKVYSSSGGKVFVKTSDQ